MLGSFCETNHESNARKNQHKREIATVLHVLVGAPFCERHSVVSSHAVFTSEQTLENPKKCATLSHFFSGTRPLFGRCSRSTSRSVVMTFDREGPFSASQKASWRTCTGKHPAISADVHYSWRAFPAPRNLSVLVVTFQKAQWQADHPRASCLPN
jgi:hypothetical protein